MIWIWRTGLGASSGINLKTSSLFSGSVFFYNSQIQFFFTYNIIGRLGSPADVEVVLPAEVRGAGDSLDVDQAGHPANDVPQLPADGSEQSSGDSGGPGHLGDPANDYRVVSTVEDGMADDSEQVTTVVGNKAGQGAPTEDNIPYLQTDDNKQVTPANDVRAGL